MPDFSKILDLCASLSSELTDVVFIGGVGVYLHLASHPLESVPLEASHDADFMISLSDYGILKDQEELTPTPRLAKHQMIVEGVEFDVYVERLSRLAVPYDEVFAHSKELHGIRTACLEHLLTLKLEALDKRGHSSKGDKDRRDLAKIGLMLGKKVKKNLLKPFMREELLVHLKELSHNLPIFSLLCGGNSHQAKAMRLKFVSFAKSFE